MGYSDFLQLSADEIAKESQSLIVVASMGNDGQAKLLYKAGEKLLTGHQLDVAWKTFGAFFKDMEQGTQGTTGGEENSTDVGEIELTEEDADAYYQVEMDDPLEQLDDDSVEGNREKEKILIEEILIEANSLVLKVENTSDESDDVKADTTPLENLLEKLKLETDLEEPTTDTEEISQFKKELEKRQDQEDKHMARKIKAFTKSPEVVTSLALQKAGLWYNLDAKILICVQCNTGLVFNPTSLRNHFSAAGIIHPGCELNDWKPRKIKEYMNEVMESLRNSDEMEGRELDILDEYDKFKAFKPINNKPVFGIPIEEGFYCKKKDCTVAWRWTSDDRHPCMAEGGLKVLVDKRCDGHVQSLSSSKKSYFRVIPDKRDSEWHDVSVGQATSSRPADLKEVEATHAPSAESQKSFLHHLRAQVDTTMQSIFKQDQSTLNPVFEYTGVAGWLDRFPDRSRIASLMPPVPYLKAPSTDKRYKVLREVVLWMFANDMGILGGGGGSHPEIGRTLTNGSRSIDTLKEFTPVKNTATASGYAAVEANMIWTFIMFFNSQPLPPDPLFIFNKMQRDAVYRVKDVLGSSIENWTSTEKQRETVAEPIRMLLGILYFPEHMPYSNPIAAQPNLQYICYGTIQPNGDYLPIHLIPPPLAAHQYVMRLKGLFYLHHTIISEGYDQKKSDWIGFAKKWVDKYLVDTCLYPFDILKRMIHGFGRVSMATPRPGVVRWDNAQKLSLNLFGYVIKFETYCLGLHRTFLEVEEFMKHHVLQEAYASIEDVDRAHGISSIKDNGDETTPGYGIISESTAQGLSNRDSDLWFQQIPPGKLGAHSSRESIFAWILGNHQVFSNLFVLIYATSYAGRGSEFEKARPINVGTHSRRNVIYDQEAYTGGIDSDYHKGFSITGIAKHNRRYMPYSHID